MHVFFSCALSNWQVSDFDRYLYTKCLKLCFKSPFFITQIKIFRWSHSLNCNTSVCSTYSLKNFSVHGGPCRNYSPDSLGFFWKTFRKVYEKTVIHQLRSVHIGKNCTLPKVPVVKTSGTILPNTDLPVSKQHLLLTTRNTYTHTHRNIKYFDSLCSNKIYTLTDLREYAL